MSARRGSFRRTAPPTASLAVLANGEDSLAVRLEVLKAAQKSIRIQALVFKGDESGLRVAEILKQKKAAGLDVRVIVDAFSNPWLQTQWMYFDLKQHGIEVEGYEAHGAAVAQRGARAAPRRRITTRSSPTSGSTRRCGSSTGKRMPPWR